MKPFGRSLNWPALGWLALGLIFSLPGAGASADISHKAIGFDQLLGWETDDHAAALSAFQKSCMDISDQTWAPICAYADQAPDAKLFFETLFVPVVVQPDETALFTGYYEPVLNGSLYRVDQYKYPIYTKPKDLEPGDPSLTRAAIDDGALAHKGLEIAYVDDPVAAYFLHVQGSGQIKLTNGNVIRVGYAGENGHPYRSAPREMVRAGVVTTAQASIAGITRWVARNPGRGRKFLQMNPSYVFFRRLEMADTAQGPMGALERPITGLRTLAVDPKFVQMGAPVWIEKGGYNEMRRLMIAQDVGAAIKGAQRADIFFGTGPVAGQLAGQVNDPGRMVVLLPIKIANELAPEG